MASESSNSDELFQRARNGDRSAGERLLESQRRRLRQMIAIRLDRRLAARLDPSDVVQEVLVDASRKLEDYWLARPLPFYMWLRQLACERIAKLHRQHLVAQKRSVRREELSATFLPNESIMELADRLVASGTSPSRHVLRDEACHRVRAALAQLPERDREVLVLRYLEQLSTEETAAVLGIARGAVKTRHLRALQRLRGLLGDDLNEDQS